MGPNTHDCDSSINHLPRRRIDDDDEPLRLLDEPLEDVDGVDELDVDRLLTDCELPVDRLLTLRELEDDEFDILLELEDDSADTVTRSPVVESVGLSFWAA